MMAPTPAPPTLTYMLRTCAADMSAHDGFVWPASGPVSCPDWNSRAVCGGGLHGLLMGEGTASLLSNNTDAKWLVVAVDSDAVVDLSGKVKVPRGEVVFCGDRTGAVADIIARGANPATCNYATLIGGDGATLTGGYGATLTGGYGATLIGGDYATLICRWWDCKADRYRVAVAECGAGGLTSGKAYRVQSKKFVEVEVAS